MFESQKDSYEYHLNILSVKMKVKFPCKMKIQHLGSLITGQTAQSDDHRYIFNQEVILKDESEKQFFELTVNLLTDKGAKYIAGVIKIYNSELIRSEGQRLVLSLSKCIDCEAFCEIRVDQVTSLRVNRNVPFDKRSMVQLVNVNREMGYKNRDAGDYQLSPLKYNNIKGVQSRSQYNFPINQNAGLKKDWETKSRGRLQPPQTVYQKSRVSPRVNYPTQETNPFPFNQNGEANHFGRQKALEAQVYKQGYQKLKDKYKKEAEINKNELNKRLALENSENNLKLQIMRYKIKVQEVQKSLNDKTLKMKQQQSLISNLQQKQMQNVYLRDQLNKKDNSLRILDDKIRNLNKTLIEMKDYATSRNQDDFSHLKELQLENQTLKMKLENKQKQFEKQLKAKIEMLNEKQFQLNSKKEHLERQKKNTADLEKAMQVKLMQHQKLLQYQKNNQKTQVQEYKTKLERSDKQISKSENEKKDYIRQIEQYKNNALKLQYEKKITIQQFDNLKNQYNQVKNYKEKYMELYREMKNIQEEKNNMQKQIQKIIHNKDYNMAENNKQYQEQIQYYKRKNREFDQKAKNLSNKLIEIEGQLEISRSQQDKIRRNLQSAIKQAAESKQKQKNAKKGQKSIQQQYSSVQSEMATLKQKLKSIDQINKLQLQKIRQQSDKMRIQFENEMVKADELSQENNQLNMQMSRLKIKLQYAEQKIDKDNLALKDKQSQVQSLIKDYEEQISSLDSNINNLRGSEKEYSNRIQKYQIDIIKLEQKVEKSKKQIKIFQEKITNYQSTLKTRQIQYSILFQQKETQTKKMFKQEQQINKSKIQNINLSNEKHKNLKIIQLIQDQNNKYKQEMIKLNGLLVQKQKRQEQLLSQIKKEKEEQAKLQFKHVNLKKEGDKNKQLLGQTINKYISTLTAINKEDQKKPFLDFLHQKSESNTFSDLINLIIYQTKDVKQIIIKQIEQNKQLTRENERLETDFTNSVNKCQNNEQLYAQQIEQLQRELVLSLEEKDQMQYQRNSMELSLNQRIKTLQMIEQELNTQNEELNFTINSLKMDYDAVNEQNMKKLNNLRRVNQEYEQKVEEQLMIIADLDERCSHLQAQLDNLSQNLLLQNESNNKKDKSLDDFKHRTSDNENVIHELKKSKKDLFQKCSELQLYLNTEKEINEKLRSSIEQQQKKSNQLKTFLSNLMKQKEAAIKSELERSQVIINLQSQLLQSKKQFQLLKEQTRRLTQTCEHQKQQIRKQLSSLKEFQLQKSQEKQRYTKLNERFRQKQKEGLLKDDLIKKLEHKMQKISQKYRSEKLQIQEQIDIKTFTTKEQIRSFNEKILSLQSQLIKKQSLLHSLQSKSQQLQLELFSKNQKNQQDEQLILHLRQQSQQLLIKINGLDINYNQISDELKERQEKLFECSGRIYHLQSILEAKEQEMMEKLEMYRLDYNEKNENLIEEYEQRLELVEKERDYYSSLIPEKDKEIHKLHQLNKTLENNQYSMRKNYEDKLKKLQEEKLSLFTLKSNEIHRLLQENKELHQTSKEKESQSKRVINELQVARKTIMNLDLKVKDCDQKIKGVNKIYQLEIEQLKKKDIAFKNYKQNVNNYQWNIQRQIKKLLQNFIKNNLENIEERNSQKSIELVRGLERSILDILSSKVNQK